MEIAEKIAMADAALGETHLYGQYEFTEKAVGMALVASCLSKGVLTVKVLKGGFRWLRRSPVIVQAQYDAVKGVCPKSPICLEDAAVRDFVWPYFLRLKQQQQ